MNAGQIQALRSLYSVPSSRELLDRLPDIADGIRERLRAIERAPDVAAIDAAIRDASGIPVLLMRLRQALQEEAAAGGTPTA